MRIYYFRSPIKELEPGATPAWWALWLLAILTDHSSRKQNTLIDYDLMPINNY